METLYDSINLFGHHRLKVLMQREGDFKGTIDALCKSSEDGKIYTVIGYSSFTNNYSSRKCHGRLDRKSLRLVKQEFMYK